MLLRRQLRDKQKTKNKTADHAFEINKARNLLSQSIRKYHECRSVYIPGLASTNYGEDHERLENEPEVLKLWLPSQLPSEHRAAWCIPGIPFLEFRFRYAQADDVLANLRRHIKFLRLSRDQTTKHIKSVSSNTRSQGIVDGFRGKINHLASQYKYARQALLALDPQEKFAPTWKRYFLELTTDDLRTPVRDNDQPDGQPSEGRFQPSWIWAVPRAPPIATTTTPSDLSPMLSPAPTPASLLPEDPATVPANQEPNSALLDGVESQDFERVQWAKCQARAERYEEEVQLTVEEMGRTLRYFEWKRDWWSSFVSGGSNVSGEFDTSSKSNAPLSAGVQDGLRAYARRQSHVYNDLIASFVGHWRKYLLAHSLGAAWLDNYPPPVDPAPARPSRGHRRSDAGPSPVTEVSVKPTISNPPTTPHDLDVDAPLDGGSDDDTPGEIDAEIDAKEMLMED